VRVSVFTPTHDPRHLDDCYASLARQTHTAWEWVVLLNGKARNWAPPDDPRVVVHVAPPKLKGIGALKREACSHATGDVLVELDHDDVLASTCLAEVVATFVANPFASLVYSDFAQIDEAGNREDTRFDEGAGWVYSETEVDGATYLRCHAMAPTPHNVGYIWYAPNHVRAFRRSAYETVGGYDPEAEVLDDQDLMIRLFLVGEFVHVPRCLYLQRWHPRNTQVDPRTNGFIQEQTVEYYRNAIVPMSLAWAHRLELATVALRTPTTVGGSPMAPLDGVEVVEIDPASPRLPYRDNAVAVLEAYDILQRVPDRARFLNECHRVLTHAGLLLTMTPSTDGRGAFQDPSHVAFYNENSFGYLTQSRLRPAIPELRARLQVSHLRTFYPSPEFEAMDVPYVQANLLAVKDGPRQGGPLLV
jgi:glycosyltransferase involved in cell wall biosynthesis